jgi:hypothetical protein
VSFVSKGKYSVELSKEGAEGAGQEEIIDRHDNLTVAGAIYRRRNALLARRRPFYPVAIKAAVEGRPSE